MSDIGATAGFVGQVAGVGGPIVANASGDIGAPSVAIGLDDGPAGEASGEDDDGYGVTGTMAGAPASGFPDGIADELMGGIVVAGGVNGDANPPEPRFDVPRGREGLPPSASEPPGGGGALPMLGNSTFGMAGHPSATVGGAPGSTLLRASDTYNKYPTAAKTAMIIRFFSEFMFVLLDESQFRPAPARFPAGRCGGFYLDWRASWPHSPR